MCCFQPADTIATSYQVSILRSAFFALLHALLSAPSSQIQTGPVSEQDSLERLARLVYRGGRRCGLLRRASRL